MIADSTRARNSIGWCTNRVGLAVLAAAAFGFALVLSGSSFVYATRVAAGKRAQLTSPETVGPFGEVIRGPRGKSEIALTFDGGADAECFEDLIATLDSAHVNSTFVIKEDLHRSMRTALQKSQSMAMRSATTRGAILI